MAATANTLAGIKRRATTDHVLTAARRLVIDTGLDVTMDQIAEAASVSRRTLFRHFGTREQLLAAAFESGMAAYREDLPVYSGDRDEWLLATCAATHRMNAPVGPGFWELTCRTDLPADLAATERRRRRNIRTTMAEIARVLWSASGGEGEPPEVLGIAVTAHLSPHFTAAVVTDVGRDWQLASELAFDAIMSVVRRLRP